MSLEPLQQCAVSHCTIEANLKREGALCDPHYQYQYRGGDPEEKIIRISENGRFRYDKVCAFDGCARRAATKGLCRTHYTMARRGQIEAKPEWGIELHPPCLVDGCERISYAKGICRPHGEQLARGEAFKNPREWRKYTELHPCLVNGCDSPAITRSLCANHASRQYKYKLTDEAHAKILSITSCENPGCPSDERLAIDHDHDTGAVRGRLCGGCNSALGFLKDDPSRIAGLLRYLEASSEERFERTSA